MFAGNKYTVNAGCRIMNVETGEVIPNDEPMFLLRAKDVQAAAVIVIYAQSCQDPSHRIMAHRAVEEFRLFAMGNPEKMGEPDTGPKPEDKADVVETQTEPEPDEVDAEDNGGSEG